MGKVMFWHGTNGKGSGVFQIFYEPLKKSFFFNKPLKRRTMIHPSCSILEVVRRFDTDDNKNAYRLDETVTFKFDVLKMIEIFEAHKKTSSSRSKR